jgi:hypothetical protein
MNKYRILFWGDNLNPITIEAESLDGIVEYLWKNEKLHIYHIMKFNGELTLWERDDKILLWNNEYSGSLWFDLDTKNVFDDAKESFFDSKHNCILPEIGIDKLSFEQFRNLVMLMWIELCDDYGGEYLELYQEISGEWINIFPD